MKNLMSDDISTPIFHNFKAEHCSWMYRASTLRQDPVVAAVPTRVRFGSSRQQQGSVPSEDSEALPSFSYRYRWAWVLLHICLPHEAPHCLTFQMTLGTHVSSIGYELLDVHSTGLGMERRAKLCTAWLAHSSPQNLGLWIQNLLVSHYYDMGA